MRETKLWREKKTKVKRQVRETLFKKQDENLGVTKRGQ